jgi:hypothetical protein
MEEFGKHPRLSRVLNQRRPRNVSGRNRRRLSAVRDFSESKNLSGFRLWQVKPNEDASRLRPDFAAIYLTGTANKIRKRLLLSAAWSI